MIGEKVLITGANGMLGSNLINLFEKNEVTGISSDLDIADHKEVNRLLSQVKPDVIIHAAAFTNVDACEKEIDKAHKVNVIGTQNLVNYCVDNNVVFVYISSTGIYGSHKDSNYTEFDEVSPTTVHHKTKYEGEKVVQNHLSKYLILRTGWLYGGSKEQSKNFVYKRYLESLEKVEMFSDDTQKGNPTSVIDLCNQIKLLLSEGQYGVYNCVNDATEVSRYDYVSEILRNFNSSCKVSIAEKGSYDRIAKVSHNESAINYSLNLAGLNVMREWKTALKEYIQDLKNE